MSRDDVVRLRVCIYESGGAAGADQDLSLEYSIDDATWVTVGGQADTDKAWRFHDGLATEHNTTTGYLTSCGTEHGLYHETPCTDGVQISADVHHEMDVTLENWGATPGDTYYFRISLESVVVPLEAASAHPCVAVAVENVSEDFTTYTEVDPNSHITRTEDHIDHVVYINEDAYTYRDKGVDHFTDFEHLIDVKATDIGGTGNTYGNFWALTNLVDDIQGIDNALGDYLTAFYYRSSTTLQVYIHECDGGTLYGDVYSPLSWATYYYFTITKTGTAFTMDVYSDAARTVLVDTLALTLHHDYAFRYIFAGITDNEGLARYVDLDIDDLILNEAGAQQFYQTVTDLAGLVDSIASTWTGHKTVTDQTGLLDSVIAAQGIKVVVGDLAGLLDTIDLSLGYKLSTADIAGLLDTVATLKAQFQSITDLAGLTDSISTAHLGHLTVADLAGLLDSIARKHHITLTVADISGFLDSIALIEHVVHAISDPLGLMDAVATVYAGYLVVSDLVGLSDSISYVYTSGGGGGDSSHYYYWRDHPGPPNPMTVDLLRGIRGVLAALRE